LDQGLCHVNHFGCHGAELGKVFHWTGLEEQS
jgi:hypothetical protein